MRYLHRGLIEHKKFKVAKGYTLYVHQFYHHAPLIDIAGDV